MESSIIYFLITAAATAAGGVSGMGGGIIIKPVLDLTGGFSPSEASILSSATVLAMAVVSTLRSARNGLEIKKDVAVKVAAGSAAGGLAGQQIFSCIAGSAGGRVCIIQNILLMLVIAFILVYMKKKEHIPALKLEGTVPVIAAGIVIGMIASFIGIGGGPLNVALFIMLFSYGAKTAAACSLVAILFTQAAKLALAAAGGELAGVQPEVLAPMLIGGIAGGFISGAISRRLSDRGVEIVFNTIQLVIFAICIINIIKA